MLLKLKRLPRLRPKTRKDRRSVNKRELRRATRMRSRLLLIRLKKLLSLLMVLPL